MFNCCSKIKKIVLFSLPSFFLFPSTIVGVSATKSGVGVGGEREVMGRRIVNDVGRHGWRVVTRGKLVSCTLFAICKLCLVYTRRDETRRARTDSRGGEWEKLRFVHVEREREREEGEASLGLGRRCHRRHRRIDRIEEKVENTRFRFIESGVHARRDRSGATSTLGSLGLKRRKSDHLRGELHGEKSLRSREPSSPNGETPFFPLFGPTLPLIPPPTCSSPVSNKFWISLC